MEISLRYGFGVRIGLVLAAKYYKLAADRNLAEAQADYALCLNRGAGVPVYYKMAADQGCAQAQHNYACCLKEGQGVPVDLIQSAHYYKLAADQNLPEGQFGYARCLENGSGVDRNLPKARAASLRHCSRHGIRPFTWDYSSRSEACEYFA
jgi:TPR repeat protein